MIDKERDIWDNAIREKLYDYEVEQMPIDWEMIANRLPERKQITWRTTFRYWSAAAAVLLAVVLGGIYLFEQDPASVQLAQPAKVQMNDKLPDQPTQEWIAQTTPTAQESTTPTELKKMATPIAAVTATPQEEVLPLQSEASEEEQTPEDIEEQTIVNSQRSAALPSQTKATQTREMPRSNQQPKQRKWSFGIGAGSVSLGTDQLVPQYVTNSAALKSESLINMNATGLSAVNLPKTNIEHKAPISFGLSVSRLLTNRLSIQTGLNYSYLRSSWSTNGTYHIETDQRLHFLGIPLSVAYRIAEWNRFQWYASAGGMAEINIAGRQQSKLFSDEIPIVKHTEHVRMKEWLWSINGRTGISYPLVRFVSVFGEVSANYYFDNGSSIETIHSEKPFNVGFNMGFRLGF